MSPDRIAQWVVTTISLALSLLALGQARRNRRTSQPRLAVTCTVERCDARTWLSVPDATWTRDDLGRLFCPEHPPATSCRVCGNDKGRARIVCSNCSVLPC